MRVPEDQPDASHDVTPSRKRVPDVGIAPAFGRKVAVPLRREDIDVNPTVRDLCEPNVRISRRRARIGVVLICLAALTMAQAGAGEQHGGTSTGLADRAFFEPVEVPLVNVDVVVTETDGRTVLGLEPADFELLEDGRPVVLSHFARPSQSGREVLPVSAGISRNELSDNAEGPRTLVIFFDDLGLAPGRRRATLDHLRGYCSRPLPPGLRLMVVSYDGSIRIQASLSDDPNVLVAALDELAGHATLDPDPERERILNDMRVTASRAATAPRGGRPAAGRAAGASIAHRPGVPSGKDVQADVRTFPPRIGAYAESRRQHIRRLLGELEGFVRSLSGLPGRKAIVFASDSLEMRPGEDLYRIWEEAFPAAAHQLGASGWSSAARFDLGSDVRRLVHYANGQRVSFYALKAPAAPAVSAEDRGLNGVGIRGAATSMANEQTLTYLSGATGGRSVADAPGLADRLSGVARELAQCYSLAYRPEHFGDDRYHTLTVRVRRGGVKVRHREGYLDSGVADRMTDRTLAAAVLGVTDNSLGIAVEAREVQPRPDGTMVVPILVNVPVDQLVLVPGEHEHSGRVTIVIAVKGEDGGLSTVQRRDYPITVANDQLLAGLHSRIAFVLGLLMRPGPQRVAVGVRDDVSRIEATASIDLDVSLPSDSLPATTGRRGSPSVPSFRERS